MKRLILLAVSLICMTANALYGQEAVLLQLKSELTANRITLKYSYKIQGDVPLTGSGTLLMQGKSYKVSGNGLDIYCDGKTRWTVDVQAREVYIESASETETELFFTNPEMLLANISGISSGPSSLSGVFTDPINKTEINFSLTGIKATDIVAGSKEFSFDTSVLGKEWTVTDLR